MIQAVTLVVDPDPFVPDTGRANYPKKKSANDLRRWRFPYLSAGRPERLTSGSSLGILRPSTNRAPHSQSATRGGYFFFAFLAGFLAAAFLAFFAAFFAMIRSPYKKRVKRQQPTNQRFTGRNERGEIPWSRWASCPAHRWFLGGLAGCRPLAGTPFTSPLQPCRFCWNSLGHTSFWITRSFWLLDHPELLDHPGGLQRLCTSPSVLPYIRTMACTM